MPLQRTETADLPIDECEPYPKAMMRFEYSPEDPSILALAERFGMRVNYERLPSGVYGVTDYSAKTITLATESWDVFFHELAHALHRTFEPKSAHGQEPEAETIAQLVAATLARLYGKPADGFSWTYMRVTKGSS